MASPYVRREKTTMLHNKMRQFQSRLLRQRMIRKRTGPRMTRYPSTSTTSSHGEEKTFVSRFCNNPPRPAVWKVLVAAGEKPLLELSNLSPNVRWTRLLHSVLAATQLTTGFSVGSKAM